MGIYHHPCRWGCQAGFSVPEENGNVNGHVGGKGSALLVITPGEGWASTTTPAGGAAHPVRQSAGCLKRMARKEGRGLPYW